MKNRFLIYRNLKKAIGITVNLLEVSLLVRLGRFRILVTLGFRLKN